MERLIKVTEFEPNEIEFEPIEYRLKIVFVVWFGTHKQYDNIDAKK